MRKLRHREAGPPAYGHQPAAKLGYTWAPPHTPSVHQTRQKPSNANHKGKTKNLDLIFWGAGGGGCYINIALP